MSQIQVLNLQSLHQGLPAITPAFGAAIAEAGAICLTDENHEPGAVLKVKGEFSTTFKLSWPPVTEQARRCWNDEEYTTEQAAYGVAFLLILQLTNLTVIERSRKGTGFDYWLGIQDSTTTLPFQRMARLEVSGIRQGNRSQINARVKQKNKQTRASDSQGLPAYIIVVEFSRPISILVQSITPKEPYFNEPDSTAPPTSNGFSRSRSSCPFKRNSRTSCTIDAPSL